MRAVQQSFSGGEMSPEMLGRIDDPRGRSGAARMRNAIPLLQGAVRRRPGFTYVNNTKGNGPAHLIPFDVAFDQTMMVEAGVGYFRFHTQGAPLLHGEAARYFPRSRVTFSTSTNTVTVRDDTGAGVARVHELIAGTPVKFVFGGAAPGASGGALVAGVTYYVVSPTSTSFQIARTPDGTAIDILTFGAGPDMMDVAYVQGDLIDYHGDCSFDGGNDFVNCTAPHGLALNDQIRFEGTLPPGLTAGTTYYVRDPADNIAFKVAATPGGAVVPLNGIVAGGGVWKFGTLGASSVFYCIQAHTNQKPPLFLFWHRQPATGEYEIPNSYASIEHLQQLTWDGSLDVLTLSHKSYATSDLRREGNTRFVFAPASFTPTLATPVLGAITVEQGRFLPIHAVSSVGVTIDGAGRLVAKFEFISDHNKSVGDTLYLSGGHFGDATTVPAIDANYLVPIVENKHYFVAVVVDATHLHLVDENGKWLSSFNGSSLFDSTKTGNPRLRDTNLSDEIEHRYVVTALDKDGVETGPSAEAYAVNTLTVEGATNTVKWSPITGADRYRVYKKLTGVFGLIGESKWNGVTPDVSFVDRDEQPDLETTPPLIDTSLTSGENPAAVARFQLRRVFGGLLSRPADLLTTRTNTESDLTFHLPLLDDDRISTRLTSRVVTEIRHIVPMDQLLVLTSAAEFRVTPVNDDALTPTSVSARAQSYIGSSHVRPLTVNNTVVFCAARGGHVRELGFVADANGWVAGDLSLRAAHLFDDFEIRAAARTAAPVPILWFVSTSGKLLGLTHAPEEQIGGWHQHDTQGVFESVGAAAEGEEDYIYVVVQREIDGQTVRMIERSAPQSIATLDDYVGLDAALTYSGAPINTISLPHLPNTEVHALADGVTYTGLTTDEDGLVTLPASASRIVAGLAFRMELQTMPLVAQIDGAAQGRTKNVFRTWVKVFEACRFSIGPTLSSLVPTLELAANVLSNGEVRTTTEGTWSDWGQLWIVQDKPLPLTILSLTTGFVPGG